MLSQFEKDYTSKNYPENIYLINKKWYNKWKERVRYEAYKEHIKGPKKESSPSK